MTTVNSAIQNVLATVRSGYGAYRECGEALFAQFGNFWLVQDKGSVYAKSQEGKAVKAEKKVLYDGLKAIGAEQNRDINPSKVWADIIKYGKEAAGITEPKKTKEASARAPKIRNTEELLALYKFNLNLETGEMDDVNIDIGRALAKLGIDLAEIN